MKKRFSANALLPTVMTAIFMLCAILILLFAADVYSRAASASQLDDDSRTALAYISEKIHRADESGAISAGSFDGCESLVIRQKSEGSTLCTYIYEYNGFLMELYADENADVSAAFGSKICAVGEFHINEVSDGVFIISCIDDSGAESRITAAVKSDSLSGE